MRIRSRPERLTPSSGRRYGRGVPGQVSDRGIVQAIDSGRGVRAVPLLLFLAVVVLVVAGLLALIYLAARYWL